MSKCAARHALAGAPMFIEKFPNIPGVIRGIQGVVDTAADGSFSIAPGAIENNIAGSNDQYIETAFSVIFSASNGNSTYGASDTVQPSSLRALVLIRSY